MIVLDKLQKINNDHTRVYVHSSIMYVNDYTKLVSFFNLAKENNLTLHTYRFFKYELRYFSKSGVSSFKLYSEIIESCLNSSTIMLNENSIYDIKETLVVNSLNNKIIILVSNMFNVLDLCQYFNNHQVVIGCINTSCTDIQLFNSNEKFLLKGVWDSTKIKNLDNSSGYFYGEDLKPFNLKKKISFATGEADVYDTDIDQLVCKIYFKQLLSKGYENKLKKILSYDFDGNAMYPKHLVYDKNSNVVGFLMKKVYGKSLIHLISNNDDLDDFTYMKKIYKVLISIINHISFLHARNILVGDLKPSNILYDNLFNIFFIDTDSFQYGDYIGIGYSSEYCHKDLDLTKTHENIRLLHFEYYAVSVLIFQTLNMCHFPFESINGSLEFQFTQNGFLDNCSEKNRILWNDLAKDIQTKFIEQFAHNKVITPIEWKLVIQKEMFNLIQKDVKIQK